MTEMRITLGTNGKSTGGYFALAKNGPAPGIIVLQEWWGLVPHIESVCDRFSTEGFTTLAPDLYHGKSASSPDDARRLAMALSIQSTEYDLKTAIRYLLREGQVKGPKVGIIGFCMGGMLALYGACENPEIGACVDFYGTPRTVEPRLENLQAPLLAFFAENDKSAPPEYAESLKQQLAQLGKNAEIHICKGASHGFFNDTRPAYHPEAAADAWKRTIQFFKEHLK